MRQLVMQLVTVGPRRRVTALAVLVPLTLSAAPASAQDVFGFLRLFSSPTAREPVYQPHEFRALPEHAPRTVRRRPKVVRTDPPKIPIKPKAPGEMTNPVPQLLADSTLRRGDIVMFPEGPKVFNGGPGTQHALTDFVPVSRAGSVVPQSARKAWQVFVPIGTLRGARRDPRRAASLPRTPETLRQLEA